MLNRFLSLVVLVLVCAGLGTGCTAKIKKARHQQRAEKYFAAGQYQKAEIEYLNVMRFEPANPEAISRLATIYFDQGRLSRAFPFLVKACELSPTNLDLQFKLGTIYLGGRKTKEAHDKAMLILAKNPQHPEAPSLLAESVSSKTALDEAQKQIDKLIAASGETAPLAIASGALALRANDVKAAEAAFKRAVALDPKSAHAHCALGGLLLFQNDLKGAEPELKAGAELSPPRSPRRLVYADFKLKTGDLESGKRLLAEISKEMPDFIPVLIRQADVAFATTNYDQCAALLTETITRDTGNTEALMLRGRLFLARGQATNAITEFENLNRLFKESSPAVHYQLGVAYLMNRDVTRSIKSLKQATALDKNALEATLLLAQLNIRKGDAEEAIAPLVELTRTRPQIPQAHLLLAEAYLKQKRPDFPQATAVYQKMSELFPKSPQVLLLLGMALAQQTNNADAYKAFEKCLELAPDNLTAVEQLATLDMSDRKFDAAFDRIQKVIEKNPKAAPPQILASKIHLAHAGDFIRQEIKQHPPAAGKTLRLADVPAAQPDVDKAENALLKAIDLDPSQNATYLMLAQLYVASDRQQKALDRLETLAKTNDLTALMQIGLIHEQLKHFDDARAAYERLLQVNPDYIAALNNLAYLDSEHLGKVDQAFTLAEKARRLQPGNPFTADTFGWVLFHKGDYIHALTALEESVSQVPQEAEIQFHLGMTHYMLGNEGPARAALLQALQSVKEFQGKDSISNRLEVLALDVKDPQTRAILEQRAQANAKDPIVTGKLAWIYDSAGAFDKAAPLYEALLKQNPDNAVVMGRLAELDATHLNKPAEALTLAKRAHELAPDSSEISHTLGRLIYQNHDYKWALSLLQGAASGTDPVPGLLYDLALAQYGAGQINEAESTMNRALQKESSPEKAAEAKQFLDLLAAGRSRSAAQPAAAKAREILNAKPGFLPALMVSALGFEQEGKPADAKAIYEKILADNATFAPAIRNLSMAYSQDPTSSQKAYDLAVKARQAFPDDPEVARTLGILSYGRGDAARAAQLLKESSEKRTDDGELFYYLGMSHYKLKQTALGKDSLKRALALNLPTNLATEATRVLTELK
jgi:tetratricopeptide (TPR) repeat protein